MKIAPKQIEVLRLLNAHRLMDIGQIKTLAFDNVTRRACRLCLSKLQSKALGGEDRAA